MKWLVAPMEPSTEPLPPSLLPALQRAPKEKCSGSLRGKTFLRRHLPSPVWRRGG